MNMKHHCDLHLHTTFSDGKSTLDCMIGAAIANGLKCIAITDHIFPGGDTGWIAQVRHAADIYRSQITILVGAEGCMLNPEGDISVGPEIRSQLDILLVDINLYTDRIFKNCTTKQRLLDDITLAMLNICKNPLVDIVAHPFNLGRIPIPLTIADFPDEMFHRIAGEFFVTQKIFEIMNTMFFWFPALEVKKFTRDYLRLIEIFKEHQVRFSIGSDAHSCCGAGNLRWAENMVAQAHIEHLLIEPLEWFPRKRM